MKKLLFSLLVLGCLAVGVKAEESAGAYFKWGDLEFTYPLANTSAICLYDLWTGQGLVGAKTRLVKWLRLNGNFGAVTSFEANGMPFLSLDFDWAGIITDETKLAKLGIWVGRDFKENENHAGVKASVQIW